MNKKTLFAIGALLLLLLALLLLRRESEGPLPTQTTTQVSGKTGPAIVSPSPSGVNQQEVVSIPSREERAKTPEEKQARYIEKAREVGNSLNRPAKFYGQILDQNNQPVSGVNVKCDLSYFGNVILPGLMPDNKQFERVSDNAGRFYVEGEIGLALDVMVQPKLGYVFKPTNLQVMLRDEGLNKPAPTLSTPEKPYIFHALKRNPTEALIKGAIAFYDCVPDGRSYIVKLRNKQVSAGTTGGDLRISVWRPVGRANQKDYDWSVKVEGAEMELVESHETFMYQAPEAGYESSWSFARQAGGRDYTREVNPKFYLKSRDGSTYGRIEIQIISDYREASGLIINYWLNPTGSRNLE